MIIKLIRHGESLHNIGAVNANEVGDCNVPLSPLGIGQAERAGSILGPLFVYSSLHYCSPYLRCRQTLEHIVHGTSRGTAEPSIDGEQLVWTATPPVAYFDPRLREMSFGYGKSKSEIDTEKELRKTHGWFYYRMDGGESPADIYDRVCTFLESMWRQSRRKQKQRILIVTHGITLRCFVMRFLHLTPDEYATLDNNENCDIVTIAEKHLLRHPQFTNGGWGVEGLRIREKA